MSTGTPKPCPFCGSANVQVVDGFGRPARWVLCRECEALGPKRDTRREAIEAWNEREA